MLPGAPKNVNRASTRTLGNAAKFVESRCKNK